MAHQHHRLALSSIQQRPQHGSLVEAVQIAGRLVEQNERRIMQEHARKADALALAARQRIAQFADRRVQALRKTRDQTGQRRLLAGLHELLGGSIGLGERDVIPHRAGEQMRLLRHIALDGAQAVRVHASDILPGNAYATVAWIPKPHEQLAERRFARTAPAG